jgi:hypothetical protein
MAEPALVLRPSKQMVVEFARALSCALYDRYLELNEQRIVYYHDADVIFRLVRGFQELRARKTLNTRKELLVGSLLSAGFFGAANLLRPHALELDSAIRIWAVKPSGGSLVGFKREAEEFLEERGVLDDMRRLLQVARIETLDAFMGELKDVAAESFVAFELTSGPWEYRLRQLMSKAGSEILSVARPGDQMKHLIADPVFGVLLTKISGTNRRPLSDYRDAAALTMLRKFVRARRDSDSVPIVRFYTETPTLKNLWTRDREVRVLLTYPGDLRESRASSLAARAVWRDASYFLIRAVFEALRFPGIELKSAGDPIVTFQELSEVAEALKEIPSEMESDISEKLDSLSVGGRSAVEVIGELETLAFVNRVWKNYKPPKPIQAIVENVERVWTFAQSARATRKLHRQMREGIEHLTAELGREVGEMRRWFDRYRDIMDRAAKLQAEAAKFSTPDPMRDLGLVRWGCDPSERAVGRIRTFWENIFSDDSQESARACEALVSEMDSLNDPEDCLVVCAALWFLGLFSSIVEVLDEFTRGNWLAAPFYLSVLRAAAFLRGKGGVSRRERETIVSGLSAKIAHVKEDEQVGRFLLGFGYVLFYCWLLENRRLLFDGYDPAGDGSREWLAMSFDVVKKAIDLLPAGSLGRAFAINHCVYIGSVGRIEEEETNKLSWRLSVIESVQEHWNYRFADTFAYRHFLAAVRAFNHKGRGREARRRICRELKSAKEWIEKASPDFGDSEITEHRSQIKELHIAAECLE